MQEGDALRGGEGIGEPVALHLVAVLLAQVLDLLGALDAFRHHVEAERMRHGDDGGGDRLVVRVGGDVADELLVDLEGVDRQALEVGKRGIAGAEVVDREGDADRLQAPQRRDRLLGVRHHHALGQLQLQLVGRDVVLGEDVAQAPDQVAAQQLRHRDVDRHGDVAQALRLPVGELRARLLHHPCTDLDDEPGFFGNRDEHPGRDVAEVAAAPAQQRLDAGDALVQERELGLVHEAELVALECLAQRRDRGGAQPRGGVHRLGVDHPGLAAVVLGLVHRGVGELQQVARHLAVVGVEADADGGRDHHFLPIVEFQRFLERGNDLFRHALGLGAVGDVLQHHGELVAAEAGDRIAFAHDLAQAPAGRLEHAVAGGVPHRVVDVLEAVEVEEQHRHPPRAASRADDRVADALAQQGTVGQAGEGVVIGEVAQLLLGALAVGDVGSDADPVAALAVGVAHFRHLHPAQELLAVLAPLPQLAAPVAVARQFLAHRQVVLGRVLRAVEERGRAVGDFLLAPAGDLLERRVDGEEAVLEVAHGDRLAHAADHFLGDAAVVLDRARAGDVARGAAHAQRPAFLVALDDLAARERPHPLAVAVAQAVLGFEGVGFAPDVLLQARAHRGEVVRVSVFGEPGFRQRDRAALDVLEQVAGTGDVERALEHVPVPEIIARTPQRQAQAVLAFLQVVVEAEFLAPPAPVRAPRDDGDREAGEQVREPRRQAVPPGRRHVQVDAGDLVAPVAVVVARPHLERVAAGIEVGVGGIVARARLDPAFVETDQAVGEAVASGRGEIERREFEAHDAVGHRHGQRLAGAQRRVAGADVDRGEHHRRGEAAADDRLRRKEVEAVDATERQLAVGQHGRRAAVELHPLQAVGEGERAEGLGGAVERGDAAVGAQPQPPHAVVGDGIHGPARQAIARQPAREARARVVEPVEPGEPGLGTDPQFAIRRFVDGAHQVGRQGVRVRRVAVEHAHAPAGPVQQVEPGHVAGPDAPEAILAQRQHAVVAEAAGDALGGDAPPRLPFPGGGVVAGNAGARRADPQAAVARQRQRAHVRIGEALAPARVGGQEGGGAPHRVQQGGAAAGANPYAPAARGCKRMHHQVGRADALVNAHQRDVAEVVEAVLARPVALQAIALRAEPEAAVGGLEHRAHVVGGGTRPQRVDVHHVAERRAGWIHLADAAFVGAEPEQPRAVHLQAGDDGVGRCTGGAGAGAQPLRAAAGRIEHREALVRHRQPDAAAPVLCHRGDGVLAGKRPGQFRGAVGAHAPEAFGRRHVQAPVVGEQQAARIGDHRGRDRLRRLRLRRQAPQAGGTGDPQAAIGTAAQLAQHHRLAVVALHRQVAHDAEGRRIHQHQAAIVAHPQAVGGIEQQGMHVGGIGRAERHPLETVRAGRMAHQAGSGRAEPQCARTVFGQRRDRAFGQAAGIFRRVRESDEGVAVVLLQAAVGADPQVAGAVLQERADGVLRQAVFGVDGLEVEIAPHGAGLHLRRQQQGSQQQDDTPTAAPERSARRRRGTGHACGLPAIPGGSLGKPCCIRHARRAPAACMAPAC